jgi:hypothetical protein
MIKFTDAEPAKSKQTAPKPAAEAVKAATPEEPDAGAARKTAASKRKKSVAT